MLQKTLAREEGTGPGRGGSRAEVAVDILDGAGSQQGPGPQAPGGGELFRSGDALVQRVLEWDPLFACVAVSGGCLQKTGSSPPWPQTP